MHVLLIVAPAPEIFCRCTGVRSKHTHANIKDGTQQSTSHKKDSLSSKVQRSSVRVGVVIISHVIKHFRAKKWVGCIHVH